MVRDLTQEELVALKQGLRSSDAFTLRRSQILLASNQGQTPQQVAAQLHCSDQCVREVIHAFHAEGLACLKGKSHATHRDQSALGSAGLAQLQELLHHSPRHLLASDEADVSWLQYLGISVFYTCRPRTFVCENLENNDPSSKSDMVCLLPDFPATK